MAIRNNKKHIRNSILILFIILVIQFYTQYPLLFHHNSLVFSDPYLYFYKISGVIDSGYFSMYKWDIHYPPGFLLFFSGSLLLAPDHIITYYFVKFGGFFLLNLYLFIAYFISYKIFRKYIISLISLLMTLSYFMLIYRFAIFVTSSFALLLILLSLVFLIEDNELNQRFKLISLGFLCPALYFINPISGLFYFVFLFILYIVHKSRDRKKIKMIRRKSIIAVIIIISLQFLSYILFIYSHNRNLLDYIRTYFGIIFNNNLNISSGLLQYSISYYYFSLFILNHPPTFYFNEFIAILFIDFYWMLGFFLIFTIIGAYNVIKKKLKNKNEEYLYITTFLCLVLSNTLYLLGRNILPNSYFVNIFLNRILEIYAPFIILLTIMGLIFFESILTQKLRKIEILNKLKNIKLRIFSRSKNRRISESMNIKILFEVLIVGLLLLNISYNNFEIYKIHYNYPLDDDTTEACFYIRNNVKCGNLFFDHTNNHIFLLCHYKQGVFNMEVYQNTTFSELDSFVLNNSITYLVLTIAKYNTSVLYDFLTLVNYSIKYSNPSYYIFYTELY